MDLIMKITDSDVLGIEPSYLDSISRHGSRGVLLNHELNVAMMYMSKFGLYKLPGGGVDLGEQIHDAFIREIKEETGYHADIMHELGYIEEHKSKTDFMQKSYCYIAKVIENTPIDHTDLSESEQQLGMMVQWLTLEEAIKVMNHSFQVCDDYSSRFMILRDKTILEHAIEFLNKNKKPTALEN